ncbi:hypothetical protein HJFPF1_07785 [Paramyrothecium foliicola]|nr:hypothetical protein HJFPF1_07785 [Paramyrothecium foliicola]
MRAGNPDGTVGMGLQLRFIAFPGLLEAYDASFGTPYGITYEGGPHEDVDGVNVIRCASETFDTPNHTTVGQAVHELRRGGRLR